MKLTPTAALHLLLFTLIAAVAELTAFAQEIRVKTGVSGDIGIEDQVASKINRYLREFKDVVVTDTNANLELKILVLEVTIGKSDTLITYALSAVVTETLTEAERRALLRVYPNATASLREYFQGRSLYADHRLYLINPENLDAKCRLIAETLDSQYIEPIRKVIEQARRRKRKSTETP